MTMRVFNHYLHPVLLLTLVFILPLMLAWWVFVPVQDIWHTLSSITAWVGSSLLVVNLILMVRQPIFVRLLGGLDRVYLWHHRTGVFAYVFLLIHPLALALSGWQNSPQLAWTMLAPWPQSGPVLLGWVSLLLLMLGLAATFALHLPYRIWRGLHIALGLGVVLGLIHGWVLTDEKTMLIVLILLSLLALSWRFVASDLGGQSRPYQVSEVTYPAKDMVEFTLKPLATSLKVQAGQFVFGAFGEGKNYQGCGEFHPFTVSGIEQDDKLQLTIKNFGSCSQRIQSIEPGVMAKLQGPFGHFLHETSSNLQLWIAGGIGITPFIAALRSKACQRDTTLVYLYQNKQDAAFLEELENYDLDSPTFTFIAVETGKTHPDFANLLSRVEQLSKREVSICGPQPMINALLPLLAKQGINSTMIHYERFDFR